MIAFNEEERNPGESKYGIRSINIVYKIITYLPMF